MKLLRNSYVMLLLFVAMPAYAEPVSQKEQEVVTKCDKAIAAADKLIASLRAELVDVRAEERIVEKQLLAQEKANKLSPQVSLGLAGLGVGAIVAGPPGAIVGAIAGFLAGVL